MENRTQFRTSTARLLRPAILAALGLWLFCAGGCAMLPFAISGASLAMPQNASLAVSGVKGVYNTGYLASDERDMNTIVRDNMLTLKAKSALLTVKGTQDVQVLALKGDLFAVGTVKNTAERDEIIRAMRQVQGVGSVKGHLPLRDPEAAPTVSADSSLENRARMALSRHLLHKNSGVEVQAVEGELCLMGVVGTHAEALDLIQYIESVTGARAISLLAIRNEYATGRTETNRLYLLEPSDAPAPQGLSLYPNAPEAAPLPRAPIALGKTMHPAAPPQAPSGNTAAFLAPARTIGAPAHAPAIAANPARVHMQQKLTALAKREQNLQARAELLTLAGQIAQDRDVSIADRLSVAAAQSTQQQSKAKIEALLSLF
ncbi:MAG TPA: BON domain-containing protein [Humidesulfovibrio sp.]|uniref:BON domain-containing protein n=1 Tax=Humidesulfovibrio sp. TaxID=2910988 RepID=UPI002BD7C741|nr:BON domain-containing protein [Humidesulfovibrio sp.]HWR02779.1 BON domain-containing protein [Humidesulfovibrio sp.]